MYIEFQLPQEKRRADIAVNVIDIDITAWARTHQITNYRTKRHKFTYRLCLQDDEAYTHFCLTWNPEYFSSHRYQIKQPK